MRFFVPITVLITCWFIGIGPSRLLAQSDPKITQWHGFRRTTFEFKGQTAFLVEPRTAQPGNPWIWRAYFPEWHTDIDSVLLERGFHVAYVAANDWFGHPRAMTVWNDFYQYLTTEKKLAPKVTLEGVSRGGLYVYAWAKRNPDKVAFIYAEAPVCDIKSWPGGKGKGPGSPADWAKLRTAFGWSEAQALAFADNPKDNLAGLAGFKVPILHTVGLDDRVVPFDENTRLLTDAYLRLGGPITILPMTRGEQTLEGHHFPIENPDQIADLIYRHNVPVVRPLERTSFIELNGSLHNLAYRLKVDKKATIAFLGGSITAGAGWRDKVSAYLTETFPETAFTFINAGIPSLGSLPHAFRLQQDVLNKGQIDLLFVESAVNDRANETPPAVQQRALEGIIRHAYTANPAVNVVLMAFVDDDKLADYKAGKIPAEVALHQRMAKAYAIPFVNLADEINQRIGANELTWAYDFKNLHPSPMGHSLYAQTINELVRRAVLIQPPPARPEPVRLPAPLDPKNYENGAYLPLEKAAKRSGFQLDPAWQPTDSAATRPGFVRVPMLTADQSGASFEIPFTGQAIGLAVVAGPDAGTLLYQVDNQPERSIDLFTRWSTSLHLPWYVLLADGLKPGPHRLRVRMASERHPKSTGNACRIVHFLVND